MTAALADVPGTIRPMEGADFAFAWETSLKVRKPHGTPWGAWSAAQGGRFREMLEMPGSFVNVLESGGVLVGFAHAVGDSLLMLYVKRDLRGFGFGLELVGSMKLGTPVPVVRPNPCWRRWAEAKNLRWREV